MFLRRGGVRASRAPRSTFNGNREGTYSSHAFPKIAIRFLEGH